MRMESMLLLKISLTFSLFINSLSFAYACLPPLDAQPASIVEKAENSQYVFAGIVTEITDTYLKVRVGQYFKGAGLNEVKISQNVDQENSCADHFVVDQQALFFTNGNMQAPLEAVYDGAFGSAREMNVDNFSQITAATQCMATYEDETLTIPCIAHKETNKVYTVMLIPNTSTGNLLFSVNDIQEAADTGFIPSPTMNADNFAQITVTTKCMATYERGRLTVPCVAHKESKKIYKLMFQPDTSTGNLLFSVNYIQQVTDTAIAMESFDKDELGAVPVNWDAGLTGFGSSNWKLEQDSSAPSPPLVLKQLGNGDYPWCVKKDSNLSNGFVSVKFKPISGRIDQAAGLVWRWKDSDNYYVARANALEDNIAIYYMQDGERFAIKYVDLPSDQPVKQNVWQTLRVDFQDNRFLVSFEGKVIIDITDDEIKGSGVVGVWTKEDSITSFDDFSYGDK
ncbi:MAG: hypothetical protein methR_P3761 [Methyloprofundus sp.]|nr:MAG: hypothetical protein methR_P3761 [Methyloprofundus sp.]